jgi:hypothetical protein
MNSQQQFKTVNSENVTCGLWAGAFATVAAIIWYIICYGMSSRWSEIGGTCFLSPFVGLAAFGPGFFIGPSLRDRKKTTNAWQAIVRGMQILFWTYVCLFAIPFGINPPLALIALLVGMTMTAGVTIPMACIAALTLYYGAASNPRPCALHGYGPHKTAMDQLQAPVD